MTLLFDSCFALRLDFLVLCLMHSELREWERNALFVEGSIDVLVHVEVHAPIVGRIHPNAYDDVHTAVGQFAKFDEGCRCF